MSSFKSSELSVLWPAVHKNASVGPLSINGCRLDVCEIRWHVLTKTLSSEKIFDLQPNVMNNFSDLIYQLGEGGFIYLFTFLVVLVVVVGVIR